MHSGKEFIPLYMYCLDMLGHTEYLEIFSPPTAFCDFSVIFHQIFLIFCQYEENKLCISCIHFCVWRSKVKVTFGWSVVLDKGTTCFKFWGQRLKVKVKVMRRQPRKISCTLFFCYITTFTMNFCETFQVHMPAVHQYVTYDLALWPWQWTLLLC